MPDTVVRDSYAARAAEYTDLFGSIAATAAEDRRLIGEWAASIEGPALDAGCGPGHWTAFLRARGVTVEGLDLVPEFVDGAAARFPDLNFRVGDLGALPVGDGSLGGILSWYSLIHTEPEQVPEILSGFARALRLGGTLLLGFFTGPQFEPFDHAVVTACSTGAHAIGDAGLVPAAIIGDLDSLRDRAAWEGRSRILHIPEQITTEEIRETITGLGYPVLRARVAR